MEAALMFTGVFAANICPFAEDFRVDQEVLRSHIRSIASVSGISGFLSNGHAGENYLLSRAEKSEVIEAVRDTVDDSCQIIAGVNAESSAEAAAEAMDAQHAGADAILIFPPFSWATSRSQDEVLSHHRAVLDAVDLPIMLYAASVSSGGMAYEPDLLAALVGLPRVVGIKEGSWEAARYEANRRLVKSINPDCAVMASGDEHLLTCFVLGTDGSQLSVACIAPELVVELYTAVQRGDLASAQVAHDRLYPVVTAIYGTAPARHAHARIKRCLQKLGRIPSDRVRSPIGELPEHEDILLEEALRSAGLYALASLE
jgi:4-hydroxy-tetrahydrodipicolinate synthase